MYDHIVFEILHTADKTITRKTLVVQIDPKKRLYRTTSWNIVG